LPAPASRWPVTAPQFFFASQRQLADTAYAGDVVGIPNHGTLRIGDTLTEGEDILVFEGVPNFAPEILRRVRLEDAMKAKKLKEALQQMAEEGVVQLFSPEDGSPAIVGVVGALQLDVLKERLIRGNMACRSPSKCRASPSAAGLIADDKADLHELHRNSSPSAAATSPATSMATRCSSRSIRILCAITRPSAGR
jgi:peptide subunit release factor RF-3